MVMLPSFDAYGYLPIGIHPATFAEIVERFGSGLVRRETIKELSDFLDWAQAAGIRRLILNGPFVTDRLEPDSVGVVLLPGEDYPRHEPRMHAAACLWPSLTPLVAIDDEEFEELALTDLRGPPYKRLEGVVELRVSSPTTS
jgi:hypothetical protein